MDTFELETVFTGIKITRYNISRIRVKSNSYTWKQIILASIMWPISAVATVAGIYRFKQLATRAYISGLQIFWFQKICIEYLFDPLYE